MKATAAAARLNQASRRLAAMGFLNPCNTFFERFADRKSKTVSDLVGCCTGKIRERFERELHRLRGYRFKRLLIVGSESDILEGRYHSDIIPKAVLGSLYAWQARFDCPLGFHTHT
jgi:DNA excision repair protein ERCC-4